MKKISFANIRKTIYYFRRNGLKNTYHAVRERLEGRKGKLAPYSYAPPSPEELEDQRRRSEEEKIVFREKN